MEQASLPPMIPPVKTWQVCRHLAECKKGLKCYRFVIFFNVFFLVVHFFVKPSSSLTSTCLCDSNAILSCLLNCPQSLTRLSFSRPTGITWVLYHIQGRLMPPSVNSLKTSKKWVKTCWHETFWVWKMQEWNSSPHKPLANKHSRWLIQLNISVGSLWFCNWPVSDVVTETFDVNDEIF